MEKKKTAAIIILNYNNYEDTIKCIESVEKFNSASIKYIIIDNGSTRQNCVTNIDNYLKKTFQNDYRYIDEIDNINKIKKLTYVTFLISKTNDGYAKGNNKGLKLADLDDDIENILILNNDVLFVQDIIPELINGLKNLNKAGIVSPVLYKKNLNGLDYTCARLDYNCLYAFFQYLFLFVDFFKILSYFKKRQHILISHPYLLEQKCIEIEMPSGSCMMIRKDLFKKVGYFDPNTFLYFEENILFQKMKNLGYNNYLLSNLKCIHLGASSSKTVPSMFTMKCNIESCKYYFKKYKKNYFIYYFIKIIQPILILKLFLLKKMSLSKR